MPDQWPVQRTFGAAPPAREADALTNLERRLSRLEAGASIQGVQRGEWSNPTTYSITPGDPENSYGGVEGVTVTLREGFSQLVLIYYELTFMSYLAPDNLSQMRVRVASSGVGQATSGWNSITANTWFTKTSGGNGAAATTTGDIGRGKIQILANLPGGEQTFVMYHTYIANGGVGLIKDRYMSVEVL